MCFLGEQLFLWTSWNYGSWVQRFSGCICLSWSRVEWWMLYAIAWEKIMMFLECWWKYAKVLNMSVSVNGTNVFLFCIGRILSPCYTHVCFRVVPNFRGYWFVFVVLVCLSCFPGLPIVENWMTNASFWWSLWIRCVSHHHKTPRMRTLLSSRSQRTAARGQLPCHTWSEVRHSMFETMSVYVTRCYNVTRKFESRVHDWCVTKSSGWGAFCRVHIGCVFFTMYTFWESLLGITSLIYCMRVP